MPIDGNAMSAAQLPPAAGKSGDNESGSPAGPRAIAALGGTAPYCRSRIARSLLTAPRDQLRNPDPAPPIARCSTRAIWRTTRRGSNCRWMKIRWQVIEATIPAYHRKEPSMHANAPHEVDVFVGERIRVIRTSLGMSQLTLAERVDVSFQQLHKYETGLTRVSASRLVMIARALGVSTATLLPGTDAPDTRDELLQIITAERDTLKAKLQQVRQIVDYQPSGSD